MKLSIRRADGTEKIIDVATQDVKLMALPGATYRPIDEKTSKTAKTVVLKRAHDDLVIGSSDDAPAVTVEKFFSECSPADRCWAVLDAPNGDAAAVVTQDGDSMAVLMGGHSGSMSDGQVLAFAGQNDSGLAPLVAGADHTMLYAGLGVAALLAAAAGGGGGGGGGGGSSGPSTVVTAAPPAPAAGALTIKGVVAAGFMKAGTVEVSAYDKDGHLLGSGIIKSDAGDYEITVAGKLGYTGAVLLVAHDIDSSAATNFVSEATGQLTNLGTNLGAVGSTPGQQTIIVINITPLTQLATLKLGIDVNSGAPIGAVTADAAHIAAVNQSIGSFFGVDDILGSLSTINDPGFRATAGSASFMYGVALAKLAVLDAQYGGVAPSRC